jgi:hypothetical protein
MLLFRDILDKSFEFLFSLIVSLSKIEPLQGSDVHYWGSWMGSMKSAPDPKLFFLFQLH